MRRPRTVEAPGTAAVAVGGDNNAPILTNPTIVVHPREVTWPAWVGFVPPMASAFQPRESLREQIQATRDRGEDVVLTTATRILAGEGGVGKTQLAAWSAHHSKADLVVWVDAGSSERIITEYARAAVRVGAPGADGSDPGGDAKAFLEWLSTTSRSWLVVLDDITDPADVTGWWPPQQASGWTLATTRRRDAALTSSGRQRIDVDVYGAEESEAYLRERLNDAGLPHLIDAGLADLAAAVGHLPLALSHVAAYLINEEESCADYLARYASGRERLAELMPADGNPDDYGRPVDVTLLLALDAADAAAPVGLARPALALASVCDPAGHPEALWGTEAVLDYLSAGSADQARKALRTLHRFGLVNHSGAGGARAVRIHAVTARAARESTGNLSEVAVVAAAALHEIWPDDDPGTTDLSEALRANVGALHALTGDALWRAESEAVLYLAGHGYYQAGLHAPGLVYWQGLTEQAERLFGSLDDRTLACRNNLALAYWQAGLSAEAIGLLERVVADRESVVGADHPDAIFARANLAGAYREAGRFEETISLLEQVVRDCLRHPDMDPAGVLFAWTNLANAYRQVGRLAESADLLETIVKRRREMLGPEHRDTLHVWGDLAATYQQSGRWEDALAIEEQVLSAQSRQLGEKHPQTLVARANLANSYWRLGRLDEAIAIEEEVLEDRERLLGHEHPDTLLARDNLGVSYRTANRVTEAVRLLESVASDRARILGPSHPDTLTSRHNLASAHWAEYGPERVMAELTKVLAERRRVLGPQHPDTLEVLTDLAVAHWQLRHIVRAIRMLTQVIADQEETLGADHPHTVRNKFLLQHWSSDA